MEKSKRLQPETRGRLKTQSASCLPTSLPISTKHLQAFLLFYTIRISYTPVYPTFFLSHFAIPPRALFCKSRTPRSTTMSVAERRRQGFPQAFSSLILFSNNRHRRRSITQQPLPFLISQILQTGSQAPIHPHPQLLGRRPLLRH